MPLRRSNQLSHRPKTKLFYHFLLNYKIIMFSTLFQLFKTIFISSFSASSYPQLLQKNKISVWKYFHFFNFLSTLIFTIPIFWQLNQFNPQNFINQTNQIFPDELQITLKSQHLEINQNLPYSIQYEHQNIIVFENENKLQNPKHIPQYKSPIVISQSTLYLVDLHTKNYQSIPLPKLKEILTINQNYLNQTFEQFLNSSFYHLRLYIIIPSLVIFFFFYLITTIGRYILLIFYSTILYLFIKIFYKKNPIIQQNFDLSTTTRLSIYSLTPIIIASDIPGIYLHTPIPGYLKLSAFMVWSLLCLSYFDSDQSD
ncbi:hypothetical protein DRH14_03750 [Candidatus Shapirobacteria bacterium]|nr:MAG: hypothetical protein DRH14_03750 [Candidatus Shapirobacteria bacterium]